ncbi:response regulator [Geobacter pelophilus]|uniref:histidine kinase n=1 Tax=Geoanaerobacter pelophilus TaxID=60036 RepID=A0AAW4KYH3_9BACT|nr:response regulator [Geoanaerobacter pelophilus]
MPNNPHFVFRIIVGVVLMNLLVFGLSGYSLYASRVHYDEQARIETDNLARALEYSISGILDKIDLALLEGKTEAERQLARGGIDRGSFDNHIAATLTRVPEMGEILMATANGDVIAYGLKPGVRNTANVADRDYFIALRDKPDAGLFISKPLLGRISKKWHINLARRVNNPDGSFAGVIHGNLQINQIKKQFSSYDLGKNGMITLRSNDLSIVARQPETEKSTPGNLSITNQFNRMISEGKTSGSYKVTSRVDGIHRVISFRKVTNYPLYVNCGFATKDYLNAWYLEFYKQLALVLLFVFVTLASTRYVITSWKEKQGAIDELTAIRDELEHRVAERTFELQSINDDLLKQRALLQEEIATRRAAEEELAAKNRQLEHEITTRKQAEHERNKLENKMQQTQKLESLGVLAGGIAHDFNNILTSIVGNTDLAMAHLSPESPVREKLVSIEKAATRAADLAQQMLAYSGKGKFVVESIDLNRLVEEMGHMLEVSISKKAVLRYNLARSLPAVKADATQVRQIVMNLVINASEAIGDRSGVIAISTGSLECTESYLKDVWLADPLPEGQYVFIEVADTGCGMDKETLARIFDPFFTTKFTGRGLGMAAVLGIIRGHHGAIKVYSEPGKGSNFKILLQASEQPAELCGQDPAINDTWKGSGTVLLVDDEETVRDIGSEMLQELGFKVVTATDGQEALDIYASRPDIVLVLLDLTMPHMDGEQCFRELRLLNPNVRVVISSGYSELEVTQKFAGKGLAGFVQKPYRLAALREKLMATTISA